MEGKETSYRSTRRRESRWDEPDTPKRTWHNNEERPTQGQKHRGREWTDVSNDISEDGRDAERREERHHRRGKDLTDSNRDDVDSWDRSSERRRDHRDEEERIADRRKSSKDRDDSADGRGRQSGKLQDEDDDYVDKSRSRDEFYRDDADDKRRGWKSSKVGRGMKRSWSPDMRRRSRGDYDDYDREWSDDRRDDRPYRRDYDRDRDRHRDRDENFHRDRDPEFRNWESFRDYNDFSRDRNRDRDESDRWKHRQRDWQKDKDDDTEYNYERDAWEIPRRDSEKPSRDQKYDEDRKDKDKGDVLKSPQSSGIIGDAIERGGGNSIERGYAGGSPFMSGRGDNGPSGDYFANGGDADWMSDERGRYGDGDYRDRYSFEDDGGLDQNFGPSSSRMLGDGSMSFSMHNGRGRIPKASAGQRGRGGSGGNEARQGFSNNQGSMMRGMQQSGKGSRGRGGGKGGRGGARESQRGGGIPPPMMGPGPVPGPGPGVMVPHFGGHMGPPGSMAVLGPTPGGFPMPFGGPVGWGAGQRAGDMGMHPGLHGPGPVTSPGQAPPRFGPNMGPGPGHNMFFTSGPGRGASNVMPAPSFGGPTFGGRGMMSEKSSSNRILPRVNAPAGLAPSRGEQNDYSQHFVDTGLRPQNFIRDVDLSDRFEEYPKLKELIARKDKLVADNACPPMYMQMDLRSTELSSDLFGTKFDVILIDPPWEEYVRRAPGVGDSMEWWSFEEIQNLRIEAVADTPSFIFLWVGDAEGLDQGRLCLKKWGFRRCEDICWVKTNRDNPTPALRHDSSTILQHSKEHCLMGIRGTVRRSTDGHIIHANIDTDIIISEEPAYGSTAKPEELYHIIEHFALGKRRLELFGEDHNIRAGWVTVGKNLSSSNLNAQTYCKFVGDADGKVWLGGRGNPPVDAPHLIGTTPEIEALRPKSPPPRTQQQQQSQAANSASQPSAAPSNNKKASQGLVQQNNQVPNAGTGQSVTSSSVIVIPTTSPARGQGQGQSASNVKTGSTGQAKRSPLHLGPGLSHGVAEDEKMMGMDTPSKVTDEDIPKSLKSAVP